MNGHANLCRKLWRLVRLYSFLVHADAAWGGYFATMIRTKEEMESPPIFPDEEEEVDESPPNSPSTFGTSNSISSSVTLLNETPSRNGMEIVAREEGGKGQDRDFVPTITMREWTVRQLHALKGCDSITMGACLSSSPIFFAFVRAYTLNMLFSYTDPHKSGYVPFPGGSLLYRDERMKYLVTWTAPYLAKGKKGESLGMYGVEGRYVVFLPLSFFTVKFPSSSCGFRHLTSPTS